MHSITVKHTNSHKFIIEIDGKIIQLSYKGAGGRASIVALGDQKLQGIIADAYAAIASKEDPVALHTLFHTFGCSNALRLLESLCPEDLIHYWEQTVIQRKSLGQGCSFRSVLQNLSDTTATLAHYPRSDTFQKLHEICNNAITAPFPADHALPLSTSDCAESNGVTVRYMFQQNNLLLFDVNGHTLSLCTNRVRDISTAADLLQAVLALVGAVHNQGDLIFFTSRWGGSLVFRLLGAVCPTDTIQYFRNLAQRKADARELIEPRVILNSFHFSCNDLNNQPFTGELLSVLEQCREKSIPRLIEGNTKEVMSRSDRWVLYYDLNNISYRTITFSQITDSNLRANAVAFLRTLWCSSGTISIAQMARYFYLIRDGLNALSSCTYTPVHRVAPVHARTVKTYLECNRHKSANSISETLQLLGRMYAWASLENGSSSPANNNPFYSIEIPNKRAFLRTTTPADFDGLSIIKAHSAALPEYVQLAHDLIIVTSARSNDILRSTTESYSFLGDGSTEFHLITSKNGRPARFQIPSELATRIKQYMDQTASLRTETNSDYLFLYRPTNTRTGSFKMPRLLTYNTYNYHINRLLALYAPEKHITARQIRAESGRRYHRAGYTSGQTSIALTNTPQVAKKHYRTLSVEDEALLYHKLYQRCFSDTFSSDPIPATPELMWGHCISSGCQSAPDCRRCPYLSSTEVTESA